MYRLTPGSLGVASRLERTVTEAVGCPFLMARGVGEVKIVSSAAGRGSPTRAAQPSFGHGAAGIRFRVASKKSDQQLFVA